VAPVDRAEFDKLANEVHNQATGLPALAALRATTTTLVAELKGAYSDVAAWRTAVDDAVTKINNPAWFKPQPIKGDVQAAALHAQAFKFDYSAIKVDEKGVSILGVTVLPFDAFGKWVLRQKPPEDKIGPLIARVEKAEQDLIDVGVRLRDADIELRERSSQLARVQSEAREALRRGSDARSKANQARTAADEARRRADRARNDIQALERQADKASRQVTRLRQVVNDLNNALR